MCPMGTSQYMWIMELNRERVIHLNKNRPHEMFNFWWELLDNSYSLVSDRPSIWSAIINSPIVATTLLSVQWASFRWKGLPYMVDETAICQGFAHANLIVITGEYNRAEQNVHFWYAFSTTCSYLFPDSLNVLPQISHIGNWKTHFPTNVRIHPPQPSIEATYLLSTLAYWWLPEARVVLVLLLSFLQLIFSPGENESYCF